MSRKLKLRVIGWRTDGTDLCGSCLLVFSANTRTQIRNGSPASSQKARRELLTLRMKPLFSFGLVVSSWIHFWNSFIRPLILLAYVASSFMKEFQVFQ